MADLDVIRVKILECVSPRLLDASGDKRDSPGAVPDLALMHVMGGVSWISCSSVNARVKMHCSSRGITHIAVHILQKQLPHENLTCRAQRALAGHSSASKLEI